MPYLLVVVGFYQVLWGHAPLGILMLHGLLFGTFASVYTWRRNLSPLRDAVDLAVDARWLRLGGQKIDRRELKSGVLVPTYPRPLVRLERASLEPALELEVENEGEGDALLSTLGFGVEQTVARFRGPSWFNTPHAIVYGMFAGFLVVIGLAFITSLILGPVALPFAVLVGAVLLAIASVMPSSIEVGTDGVQLRWLGRSRWVAYPRIRTVRTEMRAVGRSRVIFVVLDLQGGDSVTFPVTNRQLDFGRAETVSHRIRAALARARAEREDVDLSERLRRGGRPILGWVQSLRRVGIAGSHRTAATSSDDLWAVVENPAAPAVERAAAAVALRSMPEEPAGPRITRVARSTAAKPLRIALERVAREVDDDGFAEALAELEPAPSSEPPRERRFV